MSWSAIYLRGARRVADPRTYVILLLGILLGAVPPVLLVSLTARDAGSALVVVILAAIWLWVVGTFTWGALHMAAADHPGRRATSDVLRATMTRLGAFLCVSLLLLAGAIAGACGLSIIAMIGLGGTSTAPILALVTPVFLVVGGLGYLGLVLFSRLAFAAVAVDGTSATTSLRRSVWTVRKRPMESIFWAAGDAVLQTGLVTAFALPVLTGASLGLAIEGRFYGIDAFQEIVDGTVDGAAAVIGLLLWLVIVGTFVLLTLGGLASFGAGSSVGFWQALPGDAVRPAAPRTAARAFCDECGAPKAAGATFCDACGATLALA